MKHLDLIDRNGDIRQHTLRDHNPSKTLCGLDATGITQEASGNAACGNCARLEAQAARKAEKKETR
jgi:hypothetical protein